MAYLKAMAGALAIMMAAGAIADFELSETDSAIYVRVWSHAGQDDADMQKQVAAMLPRSVNRRDVVVIGDVET